MSLFRGMMVLRTMVLGRLGSLFTPIQERVLYPSHRSGGGGNDIAKNVNPYRHSLSQYTRV